MLRFWVEFKRRTFSSANGSPLFPHAKPQRFPVSSSFHFLPVYLLTTLSSVLFQTNSILVWSQKYLQFFHIHISFCHKLYTNPRPWIYSVIQFLPSSTSGWCSNVNNFDFTLIDMIMNSWFHQGGSLLFHLNLLLVFDRCVYLIFHLVVI